jgi:hypothetical protein
MLSYEDPVGYRGSRNVPKEMSAVHLAAHPGFAKYNNTVSGKGISYDPDLKNSQCDTPLL